MALICGAIAAALALTAVLLVDATVLTRTELDKAATVAKLVTLGIACANALGVVTLANRYHSFNRSAETVDNATDQFTAASPANESQALALLHDYQLARAMAPPLPEWLWKVRQASLNALWSEHRAR
jgi:hypothetical protein